MQGDWGTGAGHLPQRGDQELVLEADQVLSGPQDDGRRYNQRAA